MAADHFSLFETAIGACGIAWDARGVIAGVQLPEANASATRVRMQRRHPNASEAAPPAQVRGAIDAIVALLGGELRNLADVQIDLEAVDAFARAVYDIARRIPPGQTLTYGDIAKQLGEAALAQEVGVALARNPFPLIVPCHRVLGAGGKLGGFSAPGGVTTKLQLLAIEGVAINGQLDLFAGAPRRD